MSFRPPISFKQGEILECMKRYLLVTGPRFASKSLGCLHDIPWHLWNTPGACGMMLGRTTTQNSDAGLWTLLINDTIPKWIRGETLIFDKNGSPSPGPLMPFGFNWVTEPRMEAVSHKLYFEVTNKFGGASRYYLDSLDVESDAETKLKGKMFSHIYWTELSNFRFRKTFDVVQECLRMPHLRPDQHKLVADTNPAEEGTDSWIWKLWYWFRTVDLDNLTEETKDDLNLQAFEGEELAEMVTGLKELQAQLEVQEYSIDSNCFITKAQKRAQFAKYAHDPDLISRYYRGKWTRASGDGIFSEVYRPQIQLIPPPDTPKEKEPEFMLPEENCIELGTGGDMGRRNTAIAFIEPIQMEIKEQTKDGEQTVIKTGFKVLDEYVSLGEQQRISLIAEEMMERVEFWQRYCPKPPLWRHISDNSAFSMDSVSESDEAKEIYRRTNGVIELESITDKRSGIKGHGAVEKRISLTQRIFFENRILINSAKCPNICEMLSSMKRNGQGKLATNNIFKHCFDCLSYYISWKCWTEMISAPRIPTNKEPARILVTSL